MSVKLGLYRHFKGSYYMAFNYVMDTVDGSTRIQYFNVFYPTLGYYVRPIEEWFDDVSDREDNVTGQTTRFEVVKTLDDVVANASTEQLVKELRKRKDSPYQTLDIDGLNDEVFSHDYVVGVKHEETEDYPKGVETQTVFDTPREAWRFMHEHPLKKNTGVFKRTFIELNEE